MLSYFTLENIKLNISIRKVFSLLVILLITYLLAVGYLARQPHALAQGSGTAITGYAWSDTVGWISMSGSGYGLFIADNGTITGYAWSDNIGWISANSSDLSGCPSGTCSASINDDLELVGWLRALSGGTSGSGGWDGFISLSGSNYGPTRQESGNFSGYAWGSDVVGWIDFSQAATEYAADPQADLQVRKIGDEEWQESSLTINPGEEIELSWNLDDTTNTVSCEAVPPAYGFSTESAVSGTDSEIEEPIGDTSHIYRLLCYSDSTEAVDTVTVNTIGGEGAQFCPGTEVDFVDRDTDVTLCWELGTNDANMCSIKAGNFEILSPLPSDTGTVTHRMLGEVTFTLDCIGGDSDTMRVQVLPDVQET